MPASQSRSALERELMSQIRQEQISRPEQFDEAVMRVFDGVIGEHGRAEFMQFVLPKLLSRHRGNYEAAGSRAVRIIDEGSYKKRGEIGEYFRTVLGVQTAPTRHARVKNTPQKSAMHVEPEKIEYMRVPPKFAPVSSQDKLAEGLLKTVDRGYIRISGSYSIGTTNRLHYFGLEQDRLQEGLIKFRHWNTNGGKGGWSDAYVSIDDVLKMKGKIQENPSCFVATAVYGNPNAPQVQVLRELRDNVLIHNPVGRRFVDFYYSGVGQRAANFISENLPSL